MSIWVIKEGRREGPYDEQDVRELVYEGTYTDSDPAIRDGQIDWTTLGALLRRPQPAEPPPIPAPLAEPPPLPPHPALDAPAPPMPDPAPLPATMLAPETPEPPPITTPRPIPVTVIDFQMPFGSMVILMLKWALAAIPALLILLIIGALFWSAIFAILAAALGR